MNCGSCIVDLGKTETGKKEQWCLGVPKNEERITKSVTS